MASQETYDMDWDGENARAGIVRLTSTFYGTVMSQPVTLSRDSPDKTGSRHSHAAAPLHPAGRQRYYLKTVGSVSHLSGQLMSTG